MSEPLFKFNLPFNLGSHKFQAISSGLAGACYALALWAMLDATLYSHYANAATVHVTFVDWIPFICSTLGTIVVSSLNKVQLVNSDFGFDTSSGLQWQARIVLFVGFALLAVGISGSLLVLILKFVVHGFTEMPTIGMGLENVLSNAFLVVCCCILWFSNNMEEDNSLAL